MTCPHFDTELGCARAASVTLQALVVAKGLKAGVLIAFDDSDRPKMLDQDFERNFCAFFGTVDRWRELWRRARETNDTRAQTTKDREKGTRYTFTRVLAAPIQLGSRPMVMMIGQQEEQFEESFHARAEEISSLHINEIKDHLEELCKWLPRSGAEQRSSALKPAAE